MTESGLFIILMCDNSWCIEHRTAQQLMMFIHPRLSVQPTSLSMICSFVILFIDIIYVYSQQGQAM